MVFSERKLEVGLGLSHLKREDFAVGIRQEPFLLIFNLHFNFIFCFFKKQGWRGGRERVCSSGSLESSSALRAAREEDAMREAGKGRFYFSRSVERG